MKAHSSCTSCPNSPNYYWNQALDSFERSDWNHFAEHEMYMYLFLFAISTLGE